MINHWHPLHLPWVVALFTSLTTCCAILNVFWACATMYILVLDPEDEIYTVEHPLSKHQSVSSIINQVKPIHLFTKFWSTTLIEHTLVYSKHSNRAISYASVQDCTYKYGCTADVNYAGQRFHDNDNVYSLLQCQYIKSFNADRCPVTNIIHQETYYGIYCKVMSNSCQTTRHATKKTKNSVVQPLVRDFECMCCFFYNPISIFN